MFFSNNLLLLHIIVTFWDFDLQMSKGIVKGW